MKFEIEDFIAKLNSFKCNESIEFRLRFQKTWLNYLTNKDKSTEKELLRLIFEYQNFMNSKKTNQRINESTVRRINKKRSL